MLAMLIIVLAKSSQGGSDSGAPFFEMGPVGILGSRAVIQTYVLSSLII